MLLRRDTQVMQLPMLKGDASFDLFWTDLLPTVLLFWDLECSSSDFTLSTLFTEPFRGNGCCAYGKEISWWQTVQVALPGLLYTPSISALLCEGSGITWEISGFLGFWLIPVTPVMPISTFSHAVTANLLQLLFQVSSDKHDY